MLQAKARRHALAADAVVSHRHFQHAVLDMAPHLDPGGVAVADGVGDALLHGAVDAVFLILRECQPGQRLFQLDLAPLLCAMLVHILLSAPERFSFSSESGRSALTERRTSFIPLRAVSAINSI